MVVNKKKLIYISHPSSGLEENTRAIENIIRILYSNDVLFDNYCFVSPVHCYGFMYNDVEYEKGIQFCLDLLDNCDGMLVFGDWKSSRGCNMEVKHCESNDIPYIIIGNKDDLISRLSTNLTNDIHNIMIHR